ncbi:hypothetical protein MTO96_016923 [Rhipicephalus appendiculatus]
MSAIFFLCGPEEQVRRTPGQGRAACTAKAGLPSTVRGRGVNGARAFWVVQGAAAAEKASLEVAHSGPVDAFRTPLETWSREEEGGSRGFLHNCPRFVDDGPPPCPPFALASKGR